MQEAQQLLIRHIARFGTYKTTVQYEQDFSRRKSRAMADDFKEQFLIVQKMSMSTRVNTTQARHAELTAGTLVRV